MGNLFAAKLLKQIFWILIAVAICSCGGKEYSQEKVSRDNAIQEVALTNLKLTTGVSEIEKEVETTVQDEVEAKAFEQFQSQKEAALEKILGTMYDMVWHAIIPFSVGGGVDLYYFPNCIDGTAMATMELIQPDGSGPIPNRLGTYELIAFTRQKVSKEETENLKKMKNRIWYILTQMGHWAFQEKFEPEETCELPTEDEKGTIYLIIDEYKKEGVDFIINNKKYGLLICMEIYKSECDYARNNGSAKLFKVLKEKGGYPYSDMDRSPVVNP